MKLWGPILLAAAATVRAPVSHADDLDLGISADIDFGALEDVEQLSLAELLERPVSAASGFSQKPSDSPTVVTTIDADEIQRFGHRTLADALRGMRAIYTGNDRNYAYIGTRGISLPGDYNTRFALSIDGHTVNDPGYQQALVGLELGLPTIAIERVELVRGGSWLAHGSNALLGAIQVTTATGASRPGLHVYSTTRATAETADDPANRSAIASRGEDVSASYGTVTERGIDVFVAGAYSYDPGLSAIYFPELEGRDEPCADARRRTMPMCTGVVFGSDTEEVANTYASIGYKDWKLHLLASRRDKAVPTAPFESRIGDRVSMRDERMWANLEYRTTGTRFDVVGRAAADYYAYHGTFPFTIDPAENEGQDSYPVRDGTTAPTFAAELRTRYRVGDVGDHLRDVEIGAGGEASTANVHQWGAEHLANAPPAYYIDRTDRVSQLSLFSHVAGRAFDHVVGFAAVRADYYPHYAQLALDPQIGVVLDGGTHGRLRTTWSRGHRAPNAYERYYGTSFGNAPSEIQSERSDTQEVSFERYLGKNFRFMIIGFHVDVRDLIAVTEEVDQVGVFENKGTIRSLGGAAEVEGRWDDLRVRGSYMYADVEDDQSMRPGNSPAQLASLQVLAPLARGRADIGVQSVFVGERTSFGGGAIPRLFTTNVVFTVKDVIQQLDLTAGVTNLFDERGGDPGSEEHRMSSIPHDPRIVWLRLGVGIP